MENIFIVNPKAGNGKARKVCDNIIKFAASDNKLTEIKYAFTHKKGHAKELASIYSETYPKAIIYSVGGDGTLNEVINGINKNSKLGIIPAGSGNDFYRISKNIEGTQKINLGVVNERKFINIASIGMDAIIADEANNLKEQNKKFLVYPRAILNSLKDMQNIKYKINSDDRESALLVVGNGKYYGNGVPINPEYDLNNNNFNVISTSKLTKKQMLLLFLKLLKGNHLEDKLVNHHLFDNFSIESNTPIICNVDGEIIKDTKFDFKIIKDGIILTNEHPQYVKKAIKLIK